MRVYSLPHGALLMTETLAEYLSATALMLKYDDLIKRPPVWMPGGFASFKESNSRTT
jgi:hypothetical protein